MLLHVCHDMHVYLCSKAAKLSSLIPRPFSALGFDHLQKQKQKEDLVTHNDVR